MECLYLIFDNKMSWSFYKLRRCLAGRVQPHIEDSFSSISNLFTRLSFPLFSYPFKRTLPDSAYLPSCLCCCLLAWLSPFSPSPLSMNMCTACLTLSLLPFPSVYEHVHGLPDSLPSPLPLCLWTCARLAWLSPFSPSPLSMNMCTACLTLSLLPFPSVYEHVHGLPDSLPSPLPLCLWTCARLAWLSPFSPSPLSMNMCTACLTLSLLPFPSVYEHVHGLPDSLPSPLPLCLWTCARLAWLSPFSPSPLSMNMCTACLTLSLLPFTLSMNMCTACLTLSLLPFPSVYEHVHGLPDSLPSPLPLCLWTCARLAWLSPFSPSVYEHVHGLPDSLPSPLPLCLWTCARLAWLSPFSPSPLSMNMCTACLTLSLLPFPSVYEHVHPFHSVFAFPNQ